MADKKKCEACGQGFAKGEEIVVVIPPVLYVKLVGAKTTYFHKECSPFPATSEPTEVPDETPPC